MSEAGRQRRLVLLLGAAIGSAIAWAARERIADSLTDSQARRPVGRFARHFYREIRPHHEGFHDALEALALTPQDRLVEIGCGGGTFLELALRSGCSAKALDHSPDMVRLASERNASAISEDRLKVLERDAERLPFAAGDFTAAALNDVLLVLDDPATVLAEIHRVLVEDGRLTVHTRAPEVESLMGRLGLRWMARRLHFYDDQELEAALIEAGFRDVAVQRSERARSQLATGRRG